MRELIEAALEDAINQLLRSDSDILIMDVNERTISHRLANYLEPHFSGWNVDCEYNRHRDKPKRLNIRRRNIKSNGNIKGSLDLYNSIVEEISKYERQTEFKILDLTYLDEKYYEYQTDRDVVQAAQCFRINLNNRATHQ